MEEMAKQRRDASDGLIVPSRGLIGFRTDVNPLTRGTASPSRVRRLRPVGRRDRARHTGVAGLGRTGNLSRSHLTQRTMWAVLVARNGRRTYEGQGVGINTRAEDSTSMRTARSQKKKLHQHALSQTALSFRDRGRPRDWASAGHGFASRTRCGGDPRWSGVAQDTSTASGAARAKARAKARGSCRRRGAEQTATDFPVGGETSPGRSTRPPVPAGSWLRSTGCTVRPAPAPPGEHRDQTQHGSATAAQDADHLGIRLVGPASTRICSRSLRCERRPISACAAQRISSVADPATPTGSGGRWIRRCWVSRRLTEKTRYGPIQDRRRRQWTGQNARLMLPTTSGTRGEDGRPTGVVRPGRFRYDRR